MEKRHFKAVYQSLACRTPKLGYASFECSGCKDIKYIYRSCGNRFCAQCGVYSTYKWGEQSLSRLLNIKHHHVVFTLPKPLRHISKLNENILHDLLFKCSSEVMLNWFSKKHKIKPGMFSVLHTAGSDLKYHPHIHMVITGGGLAEKDMSVCELDKDYLTRQRFIGMLFRKSFIKHLIKLDLNGELIKPNKYKNDSLAFSAWLRNLKDKHWIISIQKPLDDLNQIVAYVGRYTKRACISEYKIESIDNDIIKFKFNDYKRSSKSGPVIQTIKEMGFVEFFDQLFQHVPTKGYRMIRYNGIYCSHYRQYIPQTQNQHFETVNIDEKDWGEFKELRKLDLLNGNPDQLICPNCNIQYTFIGIIYPGKELINDP